jgi:predicted RNA-binding protein with TRAM domain
MYGNNYGNSNRGGGFNRGGQGGGGFNKQNFAPVREGEEHDVTVEAVGEKGDGICRVKGFVLFVPGVKEGETFRVRITKVLRKVGFGEKIGEALSVPQQDSRREQEVQVEPEKKYEDTEDFGEEPSEEEAPAEEPVEEEPSVDEELPLEEDAPIEEPAEEAPAEEPVGETPSEDVVATEEKMDEPPVPPENEKEDGELPADYKEE